MNRVVLLAGLATPLVVSVHTVVSFDFAVGIVPGWHTTIFPPYFVAGAIYSGFAMVMTLAIPIRKVYGLEDIVTMRHLDDMAKVMLATGLIVAYGYMMEWFMAAYGGDKYDIFMILNRMKGPFAPFYWSLIACNIVIPQAMWSRKVRASVPALFVISLIVNTGMWLERFVIVVISLSRDYIPSIWNMYYPTKWDWMTYIGTFGLVLYAVLAVRALPPDDFDCGDAFTGAGDGRETGVAAATERRYATDISSQHEHDRAAEHLWRRVYRRAAGLRAV